MMSSMLDAMCAVGLAPWKNLDLRADDRLVRYRVEGDKPGSRNGWAVLHDGPMRAGAFGSWKTGETHTWCATPSPNARPPTPAERAALQRAMKAAQQARLAEQRAVHASARERAQKLWARARPAQDDHPYLRRKGVPVIPAIGMRQLRDALLIPARDADGTLHTLQFIGPDGTKRFLTGGRIKGCYFAIGRGRPERCLLLAEGLATGSTLYQATGHAVAVAFNCANLEPVARALRAKFPALRLVVCADNDQHTPGNPGVTHAQAAARAVGGCVAIPRFARNAA